MHTAQNGLEALEILKRYMSHMIMHDQRMPEMTGGQLLSQVEGLQEGAYGTLISTGQLEVE